MLNTSERHPHGAGFDTASIAALLHSIRGLCRKLQVASHNTPTDCWVSFLGGVYDVTHLIRDHPGSLTEPILAAAGTDISHWFNPNTGDIRTHLDPETQLPVPYCPQQGVVLHVTPIEPTTTYDCSVQVPWWKDITLRVGLLSSKAQLVRVKNVLTEQEDTMEVPSEETVGQVRRRYLALNGHAASYTWKALARTGPSNAQYDFKELDLNKTLQENGVADESGTFESLDMPSDYHIPVLHVYWNDDLTVA